MTTQTTEIRLFEVPTNDMLNIGMRVFYKGYDGEYAAHRTGYIVDKFTDKDGIITFNVEGCAYTCDELRLIH